MGSNGTARSRSRARAATRTKRRSRYLQTPGWLTPAAARAELSPDTTPVQFADCLQGLQSQNLEVESGDFVVLRRDGLIAYQLAVVVDDELQGITDVVRGIDLMDSTPRQIWLQRLLGYSTPGYCHLPVAINERGQKLSKSHGAPPIPLDDPADVLVSALEMLRQEPPDELKTATLQDVWQWAAENWDIEVLTGMTDIPTPENRLR
ncbi:MAG: glutamate--tRNA ligase family protein [Woeseiaceae bacterium]